jgi:hypothetical protein
MAKQDAKLTARDLAELKDFIDRLRKELKGLKGNQQELIDLNKTAKDLLRPELAKEQSKLEKKADKPLADTRKLQDSEKMKKMRRRPKLPKAPYTPETDEEMVPPKEEDTDEPDEAKGKAKDEKKADKKADKDKKDEDEEEPLYMPALGGPRPKLDPRFADKRRPVDKKAKRGENDAEMDREELSQRQSGKLQELSEAEESLGSDQRSLEQMLDQLRQAAENQNSRSGQQGKPRDSENGQTGQDLAQMLQSQAFQQALAMATRMQQMAQGRSGQQAQGQTQAARMNGQSTTGNLRGGMRPGQAGEAELGKLDLATRSVILKMQPKVREELLQGMQEEGPEGYRKFIQDYFKRLSKEKSTK